MFVTPHRQCQTKTYMKPAIPHQHFVRTVSTFSVVQYPDAGTHLYVQDARTTHLNHQQSRQLQPNRNWKGLRRGQHARRLYRLQARFGLGTGVHTDLPNPAGLPANLAATGRNCSSPFEA